MENTNDAVALARTLLPAAPLPVIEYNIPVLQVERHISDAPDLLFFVCTLFFICTLLQYIITRQ
jgi:hypothetical protein